MHLLRDPLYFNIDTFTPLANNYELAIDTHVEITTRDTESSAGHKGGKLSLAKVASGQVDSDTQSSSELAQTTVIKNHPISALNKILDEHSDSKEFELNDFEQVRPNQILEIHREWQISKATEAGIFLSKMFEMVATNPKLLDNSNVPDELAIELLSNNQTEPNTIILRCNTESKTGFEIITILDTSLLTQNTEPDDLESDLAIFGIVQNVKRKGQKYSLERHFLKSMNRSLRRNLNTTQLYESFSGLNGLKQSDLEIDGPLIVLKAIAIYP